ncbi:DUF4197 domain-containing protein [Aliikangiella sp. G2MR2-5]|uniref:DUF4197 domain-containing protein n=1 Tax=Aliikangiella sp. G2MR2-5 TaxID=2788943 RepID=UPI0018AA9237|nr:DUF4197 domain-containing protein [Aliikangiella sp. G2MR2-5]
MKLKRFKGFWIICQSLIAFSLTFTLGCKDVDLSQVADTLGQYQRPLDTQTVVAGLKQALEVGTKNSVSATSKVGGFSDNPLIRIATPQKLEKVTSTLKNIGLGRYVDKFELQMNRSAEAATKSAGEVLMASIRQMSIKDAWNILNGPDNAATEYFKKTSSATLRKKFRPIISRSMNQVGFYSDYKKLLSSYEALPLTEKPNLDIEAHITNKTMSGLFTLIQDEEKKIRQNPSARVTELLRRVFGN